MTKEDNVTNCKHTRTRELRTTCFRGSVGPRYDQNPAAHGNITVDVECYDCGARRAVNINGCHREEGVWGPTLEQRRAELATAVAALPERPAPLTVRKNDESVTVTVDTEGMICFTECWKRDEPEIVAALPADWWEAASKFRRAMTVVIELREAL